MDVSKMQLSSKPPATTSGSTIGLMRVYVTLLLSPPSPALLLRELVTWK